MTAPKILALVVALQIGGWLVFDGSRAFIVGDYVTRRTGPRAGELGPWSHIVEAVGLQPRGTVVKCLHVVLGVCWLASCVCFFISPHRGWWALLISSICTLWYLPVGTALSLIEIAILLSPSMRSLK